MSKLTDAQLRSAVMGENHQRCAHCDHRKGGAEGTIWCRRCLEWWRQQYANEIMEAERAEQST
jgi:hypothetical protein